MVYFGITKKKQQHRTKKIKWTHVFYVLLLIICFYVLSVYWALTNLLFSSNKIDVFKDGLQEIAFYFRNFDRNVSNMLLTVDDISTAYQKGENVFVTKEKEVEASLLYIRKNKDYLKKLWFIQYDLLLDFVSQARTYKKEIVDLLWKNQPYNYIVILQNTNEKRPNWWFFWSFAFITVDKWHLTYLEIIDAYYPDFIASDTRLLAPSWASVFLPEMKIGFIAGNKFWFTDIDGSNLKWLYEKMFNEEYSMKKVEQTIGKDLAPRLLNKNIKWVIFIRSDLLENILPWFMETAWERQFVNAWVDIIRWEYRWNKKEMYIKEVKEYFEKNKVTIFKNIINNFTLLKDNRFISIYVSGISKELEKFLKDNSLTNTFDPNYIYAWDTNTSYNKVDAFISKHIQIADPTERVIIESDTDIIPIEKLWTWTYKMTIHYTLNVPQYYTEFIEDLEKKYNIQLTSREDSILATRPAKYDNNPTEKRFETKSTIYFPKNIVVTDVWWEYIEQKPFIPDFANGLYYKMLINTNNTTKSIYITFQKN